MTEAHARRTDPETSHAAAASVRELTAKQGAVLRVFECLTEATCDVELVRQYEWRGERDPDLYPPQSESGIRTRRSELVRKGYLIDSTLRVRLDTGRRAICWERTDDGRLFR